MSSLLNRSISEIAQQGRGGRASPYNRSASGSRPATGDKWGHDGYEELNKNDRRTSTPTEKLVVEGLHWEVSEDELRTLFEAMGPVRRSFIKYDRSGRSTGTAIIHYESVADATRAKAEYDGANAKGQPIRISFEEVRGPRGAPAARGGAAGGRGGAAASGGSLQSRFDLLSRMGGERPQPPANAPKGPAGSTAAPNSRSNMRGVPNAPRGGDSRNVRGGGRVVGRGGKGIVAGASGREKRMPKSAGDLDAELDAFMKAPPPASGALAESTHAPKAGEDADIEMK